MHTKRTLYESQGGLHFLSMNITFSKPVHELLVTNVGHALGRILNMHTQETPLGLNLHTLRGSRNFVREGVQA